MNWSALDVLEHCGTFLQTSYGGIILLQQLNNEFSLISPRVKKALVNPDPNLIAYSLNRMQAEPTGIEVDILRPIADQFDEIRKGQCDDTKTTTGTKTR